MTNDDIMLAAKLNDNDVLTIDGKILRFDEYGYFKVLPKESWLSPAERRIGNVVFVSMNPATRARD